MLSSFSKKKVEAKIVFGRQQELPVRGVGYEPIDAAGSTQWSQISLLSRSLSLPSQSHCCRRRAIVTQRDRNNNNTNAITSQSPKLLFLAAIANTEEVNAITNWRTQAVIAYSNSLHSSSYMTWNAQESNNNNTRTSLKCTKWRFARDRERS